MKKPLLIFAAAAAFSFAACSNEKAAETEAVENREDAMPDADMSAGMEDPHGEMMHGAENKSKQNIPDYAGAPKQVKGQLKQVLQQYLKVKDALVASNGDAAKSAASALTGSVKKVTPEILEEEQESFAQEKISNITEYAAEINKTASVEEQRKYLQPLTEAVYAITKAFHASSDPVYYQHCPMANNNQGGYLLSSTKEIRNPYFGEKMMRCGSTQEIISQ